MTQRRKRIYLGVMAVGAVALLADRVWRSDGVMGPAETLAASPDTPGLTAAAFEWDAESIEPIPELPFPTNLPVFDLPIFGAPLGMRDSFEPPHSLADGADERGTHPAGRRADTDAFVAAHTLHAVLVTDGLIIANVDDTWMRVGDEIDGCSLTRIDETNVTFECGNDQVTLSVFTDEVLLDR